MGRVSESGTWTGRLCPFCTLGLGFARYGDPASFAACLRPQGQFRCRLTFPPVMPITEIPQAPVVRLLPLPLLLLTLLATTPALAKVPASKKLTQDSLVVESDIIASYDVNERIKELGGGSFCINPKTSEWMRGKPKKANPTNWYETCDEWMAGQMSTDRRSHGTDRVESCTCVGTMNPL